jgi:hypothetical protein
MIAGPRTTGLLIPEVTKIEKKPREVSGGLEETDSDASTLE